MNNINGKDYMSCLFRDYGIDHVFYMEAILVSTMLDLEEKYGVKPILAHSELAAGYMADGYARASQKPGVCFSQSIGAANLAASLHDAWLGNSPVIALTGYKLHSLQYRNAYQESDHKAHFSGVTKFNAMTYDAKEFPHILKQCFREVTTGTPQPAHLDILGVEGVETEDAIIDEPYVAEPRYGSFPAYRPSADEKDVAEAAAAINKSKKPVIVAGRGAKYSDKDGKLVELARKADIPIVTTPDAKTIIDETDDLWGGIVGNYGMDSANRTVKESDLVIYVGSMVSDQTTLEYTVPPIETKVIQIDINGAQIGKNYGNCIGLQGDALRVIEQLDKKVEKKSRTNWRTEVHNYVMNSLQKMSDLSKKETIEGINTAYLCNEISKVLPDDAIIVSDTGWSAVWTSTAVRMKASQDYFRAAGSLGWGLPASMGVKCANPDKPVICFMGDGGSLYYFTEFETAVRNGINTVTIINNNTMYAQCIEFNPKASPERMEQERKLVTFPTVNFTKAAESFGAFAVRVEKPEDIKPAIQKALASGKPALVEVMTDWKIMPLSPFEK